MTEPSTTPARARTGRTGLGSVSWPLVITLGAVALVRPLLSITGLADDWGRPGTPLLATVAITVLWVAAVVATRQPDPVLTLVLTGVVYGVLAIAVSGILSPILHGDLQGPLTFPPAVIAVLATNALWGAIAGLLALGVTKLSR